MPTSGQPHTSCESCDHQAAVSHSRDTSTLSGLSQPPHTLLLQAMHTTTTTHTAAGDCPGARERRGRAGSNNKRQQATTTHATAQHGTPQAHASPLSVCQPQAPTHWPAAAAAQQQPPDAGPACHCPAAAAAACLSALPGCCCHPLPVFLPLSLLFLPFLLLLLSRTDCYSRFLSPAGASPAAPAAPTALTSAVAAGSPSWFSCPRNIFTILWNQNSCRL